MASPTHPELVGLVRAFLGPSRSSHLPLPTRGVPVEDAKTPCSEFTIDNEGLRHVWYADDEDETALDAVEIVDELAFDLAPEDEPAVQEISDRFLTFVRAVESTAEAFGGTREVIELLRAMLGVVRMEGIDPPTTAREGLLNAGFISRSAAGFVRSERLTRQVLAWQDILRERSEDFAACGATTLDEWACDLIARVLGGPVRPDAIRRELRKHGVAAFGLLAAA